MVLEVAARPATLPDHRRGLGPDRGSLSPGSGASRTGWPRRTRPRHRSWWRRSRSRRASGWGSSFGAIKVALYGVSPLTVMSVRIILAGAALLVLTLIRNTPFPRGLHNWNKVLWMALFGVLMPFFLVPWGQQKINSSLAAIIMSINPFFALILGHFFSEDEIFNKRQFVAMLVGFSGVLLVFSENVDFSINGNIWGLGAIILAGIGYTISGVIAARVREISADSGTA